MVGMGVASVVYIVIFITRTKNPIIYIAAMLVTYIGLYLFMMVSWAMISDCIDNYYVEYGERADGTIYAMYSFIKKLAGSVTGSIGAWALSGIGYDNMAAVQTEAVSNSIFNVTLLIPAVFMIITFLLLVFMYPLSREKVEANAEKMRELAEQK